MTLWSPAREQLNTNLTGFSTVELLLSVALFAIIATAVVGGLVYGREGARLSLRRNQALLVAVEGLEAARTIRDGDFANLTDGTHGIDSGLGEWELSGSSDTVGEFTRALTIASVDANRKNITSTVTWQQTPLRSGSLSLSTMLTNWRALIATAGDWANPAMQGFLDLLGNNNGLKVDLYGDYAVVVSSSTPGFNMVDISDSANPSLTSSLLTISSPQNVVVDGDYAFVASSSNTQELQVADISTPATPVLADSFNASRNHDANAFAVDSNYGYLVRNNGTPEIHSFDISNPTSVSELDILNLSIANIFDIVIVGSYAFLGSSSNSDELAVIDISDPNNLSLLTTLDLTGNSDAYALTTYGNYLYVGRSDGRLDIVDITTPTAPSTVSFYAAGGAIRDLDTNGDGTLLFVASDANAAEFQVIDVSTPASSALYGSIDFASDLNGLVYDATNDRIIAVGEDNNEEVYVIEPQ